MIPPFLFLDCLILHFAHAVASGSETPSFVHQAALCYGNQVWEVCCFTG